MAEDPSLFVRVSTDKGHSTVPRALAEREGTAMRVLKQDAVDESGRPLPVKPREAAGSRTPWKRSARKRAATKPRATSGAVITPDPADVAGDTPEESA